MRYGELYNASMMIENIVTFMMAVLETNEDEAVISKMTIHTDYELFLRRLSIIYSIFRKEI